MEPTLQKVRPGEPVAIKAETWNAFIDAANAYRQGGARGAGQVAPGLPDAGTIWIRNGSGYAVDRFGVLGLDTSPMFLPGDNFSEFGRLPASFNGKTPVVGTHDGRLAVLLEPLASGKVGRAVLSGIVPMQIEDDCTYSWARFADVYYDAGHPEYSRQKLALLPAGAAEILWRESGTGTKWALVRLGSPVGQPSFWGQLSEELAVGHSASASLWLAGGYYSYTVTVHAPPVMTSAAIALGKRIEMTWYADERKFYVTAAEC